ncbi:hypothetical protein ACFZBU_42020 [Embleya sp. NPDC008237]|uniref:hypothetical protein n=1 Tax=Embleya sp. NPDC008237 TaxID=3363978 RepID=UPI0036E749B6
MPKKKSGKLAAQNFLDASQRIWDFVCEAETAKLTDQAMTWVYEAALVKTAVAFEKLMLDCLVTAINNDTSTISATTGVNFPRHLNDEVCEYLVTGGGYFDFKGGQSGLCKLIKELVGSSHYLHQVVKDPKHRTAINRLVALRNFAAHESPKSKAAALRETGGQRIGSAGAWVKRQRRFEFLLVDLEKIAADIQVAARY